MVALSILLAVGGGLVACSEAEPVAEMEQAEVEIRGRLAGEWRLVPAETELRRLKVIRAAMSGNPAQKDELGKLSKAEQSELERWSQARGPVAENMKAQLRYVENALLSFTDRHVSVKLGSDVYGPVDYEVEQAGQDSAVLRFDPGLGNGLETHHVRWGSDMQGTDRIETERRGTFGVLRMKR